MLDQNKHKTALYRLLTNILRDAVLAASLGFKGGTACYFFHALPRFSVDLDFDILTPEERDNAHSEIQARIRSVIVGEGFTIRDESLKRNTVFFLVSYEKDVPNIKIEASRRDYPNTYETKDFYGLSVKTLVRADLFAHKLVAATDRGRVASRDFFDICHFLKEGWPINQEIIRLRTGKTLGEYFSHLKGFVREKLSQRNILQGMGEVLDEKQKSWVRKNLKEELLRLIDFYRDHGVG